MHTFPVSPTANTKGTKRSRTRTDSYTAGQSVGQFPTQAVTITMFHFLFNKGKTCFFFNLWLCGVIHRGSWGNWPWRDHAQESRDHSAWVDSLLQWVTCLFRLKWFFCCCVTAFYVCSAYFAVKILSTRCHNDRCNSLRYCKAGHKSALISFSCKQVRYRHSIICFSKVANSCWC